MRVELIFFLAATVCWLGYWLVIREVILQSIEKELRQMRSALDWAVIDGAQGAQTAAAKEMETMIE